MEQPDPQTCAILGAAAEIHRQLGNGFLEAVYQETAVVEFPLKNIPFEREVSLPIKYKDVTLPTYYRADLICYSEVIVEFKTLSHLSSVEEARPLSYFNAAGLKRNLLINFGSSGLQYKRLAWGYEDVPSA